MTHARTARVWAIRPGAALGQQQVPPSSYIPFSSSPSPHAHHLHPPLTSRVVCTFWRSQIVLLPRIQQIGKCSQVAAARATEIPGQPLSCCRLPSLIGGTARCPVALLPCRPVAVSLCRCPQPFNNKNLNKTFGAAF